MSYGIKLFAEKKRANCDKWELIGTKEIMSEVKYILLTNTDSNFTFDNDIDSDTFDYIDVSELSHGLLDQYSGNLDEYYTVRTFDIHDMHVLCDKFISKFQNTMLMCYKALGIKSELEEESYHVLDVQYVEKQEPLTFPVNKDLFEQLNDESANYYKAIWWKGVLATIQTLAEENYELDKNAKIRLVFVRSI